MKTLTAKDIESTEGVSAGYFIHIPGQPSEFHTESRSVAMRINEIRKWEHWNVTRVLITVTKGKWVET